MYWHLAHGSGKTDKVVRTPKADGSAAWEVRFFTVHALPDDLVRSTRKRGRPLQSIVVMSCFQTNLT